MRVKSLLRTTEDADSIALTYYSTVIYEESVGLSRNLSLLMGGFLQVWFLVASILTWYLIGRFGRRQLFIFGYIGFGACFLLLTIMLCLPTSNKAAGIVATFATFLAQGFFTWVRILLPRFPTPGQAYNFRV